MILVEAITGEGSVGSTVHLGPDQPCVLVDIQRGEKCLRVRLSPNNARLLAKSLLEDADASEPWAKQWHEIHKPAGPDLSIEEE